MEHVSKSTEGNLRGISLVELMMFTGMSAEQINNIKPFEPCANYFSCMDSLILQIEDVSYRTTICPGTHRVIDLLYHPQEMRLVGIRINGLGALKIIKNKYVSELIKEAMIHWDCTQGGNLDEVNEFLKTYDMEVKADIFKK